MTDHEWDGHNEDDFEALVPCPEPDDAPKPREPPQGLLDVIDANPDDPEPVLVLADWYEEQGDSTADGLRWLVDRERRPALSSTTRDWYWAAEYRSEQSAKMLPKRLADAIRGGSRVHQSSGIARWGFPTASAAYLAAARAVVEDGLPECSSVGSETAVTPDSRSNHGGRSDG